MCSLARLQPRSRIAFFGDRLLRLGKVLNPLFAQACPVGRLRVLPFVLVTRLAFLPPGCLFRYCCGRRTTHVCSATELCNTLRRVIEKLWHMILAARGSPAPRHQGKPPHLVIQLLLQYVHPRLCNESSFLYTLGPTFPPIRKTSIKPLVHRKVRPNKYRHVTISLFTTGFTTGRKKER